MQLAGIPGFVVIPAMILVLYSGRRVCGMSIRELTQKADLEYMSAAAAVRRFSERVQNNGKIAKLAQRAAHQMYNA